METDWLMVLPTHRSEELLTTTIVSTLCIVLMSSRDWKLQLRKASLLEGRSRDVRVICSLTAFGSFTTFSLHMIFARKWTCLSAVLSSVHLQKPALIDYKDIMRFHSDDYVNFLRVINPDNAASMVKQQIQCPDGWECLISSQRR